MELWKRSDSMGTDKVTINRLRTFAWVTFVILTSGYFFVYFQRISVGVVGEDIVAEVGGSLGLLSSVYYWTYTAMQIPSGILADRIGPRIASTVFLAIAAIGSFLTFAGNSFTAVVVGKVMIAAGMAVVYIPLMKLISVWFPTRDFAVLTGIVIAVGNIGAVAATGPLQLLADALGWREVYLVLGIVTLVLAALCFTVVRDHPHGRSLPSVEELEHDIDGRAVTEDSSARVPVLTGLRIVFSGGRRFWTCALAYFLVYGSIMTFQGTWAVTYFDNVYGFALSASWMVTALGIGKILSTVAIGAMTTRGIIRSKRRAMVWGTLAYALTWLTIFILSGRLDSYWFWFGISFAFGFFGGFMTLSFTQIKEWYPIAVSGTAVSGANIFLFLGASVCTTVSGAIVGTSYTLENFSELWGLMTLFAFVAVALLVLSVEKRPEDPPVGLDEVEAAMSGRQVPD